jgi:hypothetical protein
MLEDNRRSVLKAVLRQLHTVGLGCWELPHTNLNPALWSVHAFSGTSASSLSLSSTTHDLDNSGVGHLMKKDHTIAGEKGRTLCTTLCMSGGLSLLVACVEDGVLVAVPSGMQVTEGIVKKAAAAAANLQEDLKCTVQSRCLVVNLGEVDFRKVTEVKTKVRTKAKKTKQVRENVLPFSVLSWSPQAGLYLLVRSLPE